MASGMDFSVRHAGDTSFESDGLRTFFEYRDLGIGEATGGKFHAHVIRAREGHGERVGWHVQNLLQKGFDHVAECCRGHGWRVDIRYRTSTISIFRWSISSRVGRSSNTKAKERSGSRQAIVSIEPAQFLQPPGIRHREVDHSDDLELIEITSPADFATAEADEPD